MQIPTALSLRLRSVLDQLEQIAYDMEFEDSDEEDLLNDNIETKAAVKQVV